MKTTAIALALLGLVACKKGESASPTAATKPVEASADDLEPKDLSDPDGDGYDDEGYLDHSQAINFTPGTQTFDGWLDAQNRGDFDAYVALYGAKFAGIRRTADGDEKQFDLAGWTKDRKKMFGAKMEVAAEGQETALGADDSATITFIQRFRAGKYEDHGAKILVVDADDHIVREEMLWSRPGWDSSPSDPINATGMTAPITLTLIATHDAPNGDCANDDLTLQVEDAAGNHQSVVVGSTTGGDIDTPAGTTSPIKPQKKGKALYKVDGGYCAGLGVDLSLARVGDKIVVTENWSDEESGTGSEKREAVFLPAGAEIVTR